MLIKRYMHELKNEDMPQKQKIAVAFEKARREGKCKIPKR